MLLLILVGLKCMCSGSSSILVKFINTVSYEYHQVAILWYAFAGGTNFSIRASALRSNRYQAIRVSPMLSMIGHIREVTFENHNRGVILIDNTANLQRNRAFLNKIVDYTIEDNE